MNLVENMDDVIDEVVKCLESVGFIEMKYNDEPGSDDNDCSIDADKDCMIMIGITPGLTTDDYDLSFVDFYDLHANLII